MKVNMVYPSDPKDALSVYSQHLINQLKKYLDIKKLKLKKKNDPFYFLKFAKKSQKNCDLLHLQFKFGIFGSLFGRLKGVAYFPFNFGLKKNIPLVTTPHALYNPSADLDSVYEKIIGFKFKLIEDFLFNYSDLIIFHTLQGKKMLLKRGVPKRKISVIPPGIPNSSGNKEKKLINAGKKIMTTFGYIRRGRGYRKDLGSSHEVA